VTPGYQVMERSWQEKRDDIDAGISNLPEVLQAEARKRLEALRVVSPERSSMSSTAPEKPIGTAHFELAFDPATGSIVRLSEKRAGRSWASATRPLALFTYQTLTQADYTAFLEAYVRSKESWAPQDFGKPNLDPFPGAVQRLAPAP